tara:strand:- start:184 stop:405 length:222 start_codon:yes stop_codon:yes gene_type:complete
MRAHGLFGCRRQSGGTVIDPFSLAASPDICRSYPALPHSVIADVDASSSGGFFSFRSDSSACDSIMLAAVVGG